MNRFTLPAIAALLAISAASRAGAQVSNHEVVAAVNDDVVTRGDVMKAAQPLLDRLDPDLPDAERLRAGNAVVADALRALIDEKLLEAKAEQLLKERPDLKPALREHVARRVEEERREAGGERRLWRRLRDEGLSYADRVKAIEDAALRETLMGQYVLTGVSATRDEIADYYERRRESLAEPPQVKWRRLFLKGRTRGGTEEARKLAEDLARQAREGADFAELVRRNSDGPRAAEGGVWDFEPRGRRPEAIEKVLFDAPVGEVAGPVETDGDFTIVQIVDRKPGGTPSFEEAEPIVRRLLEQRKRSARYDEFLGQLERENCVEIAGAE